MPYKYYVNVYQVYEDNTGKLSEEKHIREVEVSEEMIDGIVKSLNLYEIQKGGGKISLNTKCYML